MYLTTDCGHSYLYAYDFNLVRDLMRLSRGIACAAVLQRRPGDRELLRILLDERAPAFSEQLDLAAEWRRRQLETAVDPESQAKRVDVLQTAIAANALVQAQPEQLVAVLLEVRESSLAARAERGERWFLRELRERERAADRELATQPHA